MYVKRDRLKNHLFRTEDKLDSFQSFNTTKIVKASSFHTFDLAFDKPDAYIEEISKKYVRLFSMVYIGLYFPFFTSTTTNTTQGIM